MTAAKPRTFFGRLAIRSLRCLRHVVKPPKHRFLKRCHAIIHVGANDGAERRLYDHYALEVIWVEALPEAFTRLRTNLLAFPKQSAINALLTDREGITYDFKVADNAGQSSSIFDFAGHKQLWPEIGIAETIQLRSKTLVSALRESGRTLAEFDALILDVQGAELLVIKGAGDALTNFQFIQAEAADFEAYQGACTLGTLSAFLSERGFRLRYKDCFHKEMGVGSYYDVLYEHRGD